MNKKFIFFVCFIFLIIIIGLIFGILTIYRFSIIQDISRKISENLNKDNYHMITNITDVDGNSTKTEVFYREDVGKLIASNGVYTWADGEFAYMIDDEKKEVYILNINNENIGLVSFDMYATVIPGYNTSIWQKLLIAGNINNTVKKSELDGRDCFIIKINEDKYFKTVWVDMINAVPLKAELEFEDGTKMTYTYSIKFNETRLKDIELPKIDEYTVVKAETNEVIQNAENANVDTNNNSNSVNGT